MSVDGASSPPNADDPAHDSPLLERIFEIELTEGSWPLHGEGQVPRWLREDYFLCGPADFEPHGVRYRHWLDGDGAVARLSFSPSGVQLTQRFVDTAKRRQEASAGRAIYRTFGTSFDGDELKRGIGLESPANVSAFLFGEHLLAFGEQGLPYALDPATLETRGEPCSPDLWTAPHGCYLGGEPVFLPSSDPGDGAGAVLCQQFDAASHSSSFLLFDAYDVARGPIARLPVPHAMPLGFHAAYYPR